MVRFWPVWELLAALPLALLAVFAVSGAAPLSAATYYVTVAGLGGEPEYEQRFAALARDLDKLLKRLPNRFPPLH